MPQFPGAVDLTKGVPENWGMESSSRNVIGRQETDLLVLFGNENAGTELAVENLIHFGWGATNELDIEVNRQKLQIENLDLFPDDFVRFDDLTYSVSSPRSVVSRQLKEFLLGMIEAVSGIAG